MTAQPDDHEWNIDAPAKLARTQAAIDDFLYRISKLNYLRAQLLSAREGTLKSDWRTTLVKSATESIGLQPDQQAARERAARDISALPPADWEPDRHVGWRLALNAWYEATNQCLDDIENAEKQLRSESWMSADTVTTRIAMDRDLTTASYRAGLAAGGLDVDWYDWLIDRVRKWPDKQRRDDQLDLMTLEPDYRDSMQQLPAYWA